MGVIYYLTYLNGGRDLNTLKSFLSCFIGKHLGPKLKPNPFSCPDDPSPLAVWWDRVRDLCIQWLQSVVTPLHVHPHQQGLWLLLLYGYWNFTVTFLR